MIFSILSALVGITVGVVGSSHADTVKQRNADTVKQRNADDKQCHALYQGRIDETPKCPIAK